MRLLYHRGDYNNRVVNSRISRSVNIHFTTSSTSPTTMQSNWLLRVSNILDTTFGSTGCVPIDIPRWCWTYWVPALTFDSTLFLLSLLKTIHVSRDPVQQSSLLSVLLRDSFLYYGGVMMVALANFMAWYIKPVRLPSSSSHPLLLCWFVNSDLDSFLWDIYCVSIIPINIAVNE